MERNDIKSETFGRQLNVKSLLVRLLLRWKQLLILTVCCGILGCAYGYKKESDLLKAASGESGTEQTAEKEDSPEYYDQMIAAYDQMIVDRYSYLDKTALKDIDPFNTPQVTAVLYINEAGGTAEEIELTEESLRPEISGKAVALLTALQNYVENGIVYSSVNDILGLDESNIDELVYPSLQNDTLVIKTIHPEMASAEVLMDYVITSVESEYQEMADRTGFTDTELILLNRSSAVSTFYELNAWMRNQTNSLDELIRARATFISDYSSQKSVAETAVKTSINKKTIIKKGIQFAILGALLGVIAVLLKLILSAKVLSAQELNESFETRNICVLGSNAAGLKKAILSIECENRSTLSDDARLELAASLISQLSENGSRIAVVGDINEESIRNVTEKLNSHLNGTECIALPKAGESVEDSRKLAEADCVILTAGIEESKYSALKDLLVLSANYKKPVIGTIVC